jgi:hypothetical protein
MSTNTNIIKIDNNFILSGLKDSSSHFKRFTNFSKNSDNEQLPNIRKRGLTV